MRICENREIYASLVVGGVLLVRLFLDLRYCCRRARRADLEVVVLDTRWVDRA